MRVALSVSEEKHRGKRVALNHYRLPPMCITPYHRNHAQRQTACPSELQVGSTAGGGSQLNYLWRHIDSAPKGQAYLHQNMLNIS